MKVSELIKQLQDGNVDDSEVVVMWFNPEGGGSVHTVEAVVLYDPVSRGFNPAPEGERQAAIVVGTLPSELKPDN
jgi:hypothetical protein